MTIKHCPIHDIDVNGWTHKDCFDGLKRFAEELDECITLGNLEYQRMDNSSGEKEFIDATSFIRLLQKEVYKKYELKI